MAHADGSGTGWSSTPESDVNVKLPTGLPTASVTSTDRNAAVPRKFDCTITCG